MPKPLTVDHNKLWTILKEMGISDHLTCLLRNLYAGQEAAAVRPFRYDLHQIPYTVEVTNKFNGLYLIDRVHKQLWTEVHDIVQEAVIKTISKKKKC